MSHIEIMGWVQLQINSIHVGKNLANLAKGPLVALLDWNRCVVACHSSSSLSGSHSFYYRTIHCMTQLAFLLLSQTYFG